MSNLLWGETALAVIGFILSLTAFAHLTSHTYIHIHIGAVPGVLRSHTVLLDIVAVLAGVSTHGPTSNTLGRTAQGGGGLFVGPVRPDIGSLIHASPVCKPQGILPSPTPQTVGPQIQNKQLTERFSYGSQPQRLPTPALTNPSAYQPQRLPTSPLPL